MSLKTAKGMVLDMQNLIMKNGNEIAVGNSSQNARGDLLGPGGRVVQTKEEITKAFYNRQMGSKLTNLPSDQAPVNPFIVQADTTQAEVANWEPEQMDETPLPPDLADAKANALAQSQLLAERIKQQRQKEADEKNKS
jgi:hypothetical protein